MSGASSGNRQAGWRLLVKRAIDVAAASVGLVVLAPMIATAAAAVRVSMGSPAVFRQDRPGRGGRRFSLVKLRTMRNASRPGGAPLPDEVRLTKLGRLLRAASIDELPQLWNVLKGDMSLVGPRPLLPQYLPRYSARQARRHEVMPGVTGWAQVNGRNARSWEEKLELDLWYVEHWSLGLDLKILMLTLGSVLRRDGISSEGHATMPEFMGSAADREQPGSRR
jgi:lipopolysaccharide/colanic/teichoic acid biosynthesis glycosyltransferase